MRDLEFLPSWYPILRGRKRMLHLQVSMTVVILLGFGLWMLRVNQNIRSTEVFAGELKGQLVQTESDLHKLEEQRQLRKQLRQKKQIMARLGVCVESTRLISTLESLMPREMSLVDFSMETKEEIKVPAGLARLRAEQEQQAAVVDRTLVVRMHGVAPTDNDVANFNIALSSVPYFSNVAMSYARPKSDKGYVVREFEVSFTMNINAGN